MPAKASNEPVQQDEEVDDQERSRMARRMTRRRARHRSSAYRQLAKRSGMAEEGEMAQAGQMVGDSLHCVLSVSDAKRLCTFVPSTPSSTSFDSVEFKERLRLLEQGVPQGAIQETQSNCDALLRWALTSCLQKNADVNGRRAMITAHDMYQFLRPMIGRTLFTAVVPPAGLKQRAQEQGVLAASEDDKAERAALRKRNAENKKAFQDMQARKEAVKKARTEKRAVSKEAPVVTQSA
jgi:hypothetical protein